MTRQAIAITEPTSKALLSLRQVGRISACCALIFLPFSHFLVNQFIIAAVVISLLTSTKSQFSALRRQPYSIAIIAFLALAALSFSYTSAPTHQAVSSFFKYTKLLYIPLLWALFYGHDRWRQSALTCFVAAQLLNILLVLALAHGLSFSIPAALSRVFPAPGQAMINILPLSFQIGCALFLSCYQLLRSKSMFTRIILILIIAALAYELLFLIGERTGIVVSTGAILYLFYNKLSRRGLLAAIAIVAVVFATAYFTNGTIRTKFNNLLHIQSLATQRLTNNTLDGSKTASIGLRVAFAQHSWMIIKKHPLLGAGIGSFKTEYKKTDGPLLNNKDVSDPHNSYLLTAAQFGFTGLFIMLSIIYFLWKSNVNNIALKCLLIAFLLNSVCNMTFLNAANGVLFTALAGILVAQKSNDKKLNQR